MQFDTKMQFQVRSNFSINLLIITLRFLLGFRKNTSTLWVVCVEKRLFKYLSYLINSSFRNSNFIKFKKVINQIVLFTLQTAGKKQ